MTIPDIMTPDGRRALAFLAIMGGSMVFSLFIWIALYLLRNDPHFVFYLAALAHLQVLVGMTALGWAMGRRLQLQGGTDGVTINDSTVDVHTGGEQ